MGCTHLTIEERCCLWYIAPLEPNNTGDEVVGEIIGNEIAEEYVIEHTS